ncbi:hypothetical protein HZH68_005760 [Vespula germanica]|uniref:Uncharacterized protein n=1 Tax=Vespula germanica TaxID=30212 RepID=A0A834KIA5_VESGE|nr:hypothetical protein HZH68_005760 [Vespula germanica]
MRHINKRDERVTWVESKNGYERFDRDDVTPSYGHPQANHHGLVPSAMMLRTANGVPGAWGDRIKILTSSPSSSSNETMEHREEKETTFSKEEEEEEEGEIVRSIDSYFYRRVYNEESFMTIVLCLFMEEKEKEEEGEEEEEERVGVGGREGMEKDGG